MKAIIADIDDTICRSTQKIMPEMANEINKLLDCGLEFCFISGGTTSQIKDQISLIDYCVHIMGGSGTEYIKCIPSWNGVDLVYSETIEESNKKEILDALELLTKIFKIVPKTNKDDQIQDRSSQITLSALGRHAPEEFKRNFDPERKIREEWVIFLKNILPRDKYEIRIGGTSSIDITMAGRDKRYGVEKFLMHNKFSNDDVLFFGDKLQVGGNDYPVSEICDCISVENEYETLTIFRKLIPGLHKILSFPPRGVSMKKFIKDSV